MTIDKTLDFINLPNGIEKLQHIKFDLGRATAEVIGNEREKTINRLEEKLQGSYKPKTIETFVDTIDRCCKKELRDLWELKTEEVFWNHNRDGSHIAENEERNDRIEDIREKFMVKGRKDRTRYGGYPLVYKSRYHKELFLEIVEALGLVIKAPKIRSTVEITAKEDDPGYDSNRYQEDEF